MSEAYKPFCHSFIASYEGNPAPATAILVRTFGDDPACLRQYLEAVSPRPNLLEIHPVNNTVYRRPLSQRGIEEIWRWHDKDSLNDALEHRDERTITELRNRIAWIAVWAPQIVPPTTRLVLSMGLEDNYTADAAEIVLEVIREEWPYEVVRNPLRGVERRGADFVETHSLARRGGLLMPFIANNDGSFPSERKFLAWEKAHKEAVALLRWDGAHQGRKAKEKRFVMPRNRKIFFSWQDVVNGQKFGKRR